MRIFFIILLSISSHLVICQNKGNAQNLNSKDIGYYEISRREVKCATKDEKGVIIEIGGDWGKISKEEAVKHIKNQTYNYYVKDGKNEVPVHVFKEIHLRTDRDGKGINNLDFLPNCD